MATEKKIQIKNSAGDLLFPKTKAELVVTASGANLGGVEAGAQVNKIEQIKVNGQVVTPQAKVVDITIPSAPVYTLEKAEAAESGFAATYNLKKDGVIEGASINIPKDMVVQSGEVKTVETVDTPVAGYKVGQKYIDLLLANATNQHIYILVNDLVDVYTAGTGVKLNGRAFAIDDAVVATRSWAETTFAKKATTLAGYGITDAFTKTEVTEALGKKADASALTSGLNGKADKATTLAGYGITDALTFEEIA